MNNTINMQDMRYLNLFGKITQVSTRFCFRYNEAIVFCVPKELVSKAIGENGNNVRRINEILGKRIKIVPSPRGLQDARKFMENIVKCHDCAVGQVRLETIEIKFCSRVGMVAVYPQKPKR